jgi:hypothetical protein
MHVLVPDPDLRFGIKQIKQHKWFNVYTPKKEISRGVRIGIDDTILIQKVVRQMREFHNVEERFIK